MKTILFILCFTIATTAHALELPNRVEFAAGGFDVFDYAKSAIGRIEFRSTLTPPKLEDLALNPIVGFAANTKGGVYGFGGAALAIPLSEALRASIEAGVGGYSKGGSKDLGGVFETFGGLEVTHALGDGKRVGLGFWHMSNAYTQPINPGTESLFVVFELPVY